MGDVAIDAASVK
jgi:hypothetical protein